MKRLLIRPDDHAIFEQNKDGTWSHQHTQMTHPAYCYDENLLLDLGFQFKTEGDLPEILKNQQTYTDYQSWISRSDGHGGVKGGTMEEFLTYYQL